MKYFVYLIQKNYYRYFIGNKLKISLNELLYTSSLSDSELSYNNHFEDIFNFIINNINNNFIESINNYTNYGNIVNNDFLQLIQIKWKIFYYQIIIHFTNSINNP